MWRGWLPDGCGVIGDTRDAHTNTDIMFQAIFAHAASSKRYTTHHTCVVARGRADRAI